MDSTGMPRGRWPTQLPELPDRDEQYRRASPALWKLYDSYYPDKKQPGKSALILALVRLLTKLAQPLPDVPAGKYPSLPEVQKAKRARAETIFELRQWRDAGIHQEISELLDWLAEPVTEDQKIQYRNSFTESLRLSGWPETERRVFMVHAMKPRRGAKIKYRQQWLRAWDKKLLDPEVTFRKLANDYCSCEGVRGHGSTCADRLEQAIRALRKLASKHNVLSFAESLAAHPSGKRKPK